MSPKPACPGDRCAVQTVKTKNRLDISKEVFRRRGGKYFFFCALEQELKVSSESPDSPEYLVTSLKENQKHNNTQSTTMLAAL